MSTEWHGAGPSGAPEASVDPAELSAAVAAARARLGRGEIVDLKSLQAGIDAMIAARFQLDGTSRRSALLALGDELSQLVTVAVQQRQESVEAVQGLARLRLAGRAYRAVTRRSQP